MARDGQVGRAGTAVAGLLCILGVAGIAVATPTLVRAQSVPEIAEHRIDFDLPSQDLNDALLAFADATGIQVFYESSRVQDLSSNSVTGNLTVQDALAQLLSGTGFGFRFTSPDTVSLQTADDDGALQLGPVRIGGKLPGVTEGTGSYTTGSVNTATRLPLTPRETPQTMTVVTRQQMDDFVMTSVDDVLESTSGVYLYPRGSNGPVYYTRGFELQSQYDGVPNPIGIGEYNQNPSPDSAFLDRVEVLQGASGLLTGAGEPGGTVNLLRKRPTEEFQAHVETQVGSWDKQRLVGDVSGSLVGSGAIRGRAVAVWDDSESFIDYVHDEKHGVYGVVDADLSESTIISAAVQYQENDSRINNGVPNGPDGTYLGFSRSSYFGNAQSSHRKNYLLYTLSLDTRLRSDWLIRAVYTRGRTEVAIENGNFLSGGLLDIQTGEGLTILQHRRLRREAISDSLEIYASGSLELFGRQHELVFGGSGTKNKDDAYNSGNFGTPINVYEFDPETLPLPPVADSPFFFSTERQQYGAYGVARLNVADRLKLVVGSRVSWFEYEDGGVKLQDEDTVVSPYMGIILDVGEQSSVYASYSDIFTPQSQRTRSGAPIDPVEGRNYEAGIKREFHDGRLNAAAAIFRLEQVNLPAIDDDFGNDQANICGGWCYIPQDEVVSQGVDLSLNGELLPSLNLSVGYTYSKSEHNSGGLKGDPFRTSVPVQLLRVYASYAVPDSGWTVGANLNVQDRFYNQGVRNGVSWRVEQAGVATVGLMARYRFNERLEVSLTASNIFDRRYFASSYGLYYMPYAEPRNVLAFMKYQF